MRNMSLAIIVLVFGFLTGSTIYFYNKTRGVGSNRQTASTKFQADLPTLTPSTQNQQVDSTTQAEKPKNNLSYLANVYKVQQRDSLAVIAAKFSLPWSIIKLANNITNENLVQADSSLVIPKLSSETDYYRINLLINEIRASEINRETREQSTSDWFDPLGVARKYSLGFFGINPQDDFRLVEADLSQGTASVEVKGVDHRNLVGLIQPKTKGKQGFWAIYYVENRDQSN